MKLDKIYVINLPYRTDRKEQILNELKKVDASNVEIFSAIRPQEKLILHWNKNYLNPLPNWYNGNPTTYRIGALGCLLSHVTIMKKALKNNYENILILEDDTCFINNNNITIDKIVERYSKFLDKTEYGIFYLAGNTAANCLKHIVKEVYLTNGTLTTGSYIINKKTMQYIVNNIQGYEKEIDKYYLEVIQKNFPCFICLPNLTRQRASYSDIICKNTDYDLNTLK
jgi:GR25 family glycosyltransferase involved in LPS biosynthesis